MNEICPPNAIVKYKYILHRDAIPNKDNDALNLLFIVTLPLSTPFRLSDRRAKTHLSYPAVAALPFSPINT
ncbi:MAG: hypothetical protein RBT34_09890, partial [Anaerolineaceae bacterium]|nr:hypothetical protein [Anaerolineaceae bacterium]